MGGRKLEKRWENSEIESEQKRKKRDKKKVKNYGIKLEE